jgi:hypothetical protein
MAGFYENSGDLGNTFGNAAAAFADEAKAWAITLEDVLVPEGNLVDQYSAFHYSKKSEATVAGGQAISDNAQISADNAAASAVSANASAVNAEASANSITASGVLLNTDIGVTVQGYDATNLVDADIGVTVQGYDVDTAKLDVTQTYTTPQRGTVTADTNLSYNLNTTNNFTGTPTALGTLTFTNIAAGQNGTVLLTNSADYVISAAATTKISVADLATISVTGVYVLSYFSNGTNVYVVVSGDLT